MPVSKDTLLRTVRAWVPEGAQAAERLDLGLRMRAHGVDGFLNRSFVRVGAMSAVPASVSTQCGPLGQVLDDLQSVRIAAKGG